MKLDFYGGATLNALTLNVAGAISSAATGIYNTLNAAMPQMQTSGANGSFINFIMPPALIVEHAKIVNEDNSDFGRPLMEVRTINTIPGYVKVVNPHPALSATDDELQLITQFMEDGFYYE